MKITTSGPITMEIIRSLQGELQDLQRRIKEIRERMAPLQGQMDDIFEEYQSAIRPLYARLVQLNEELKRKKSEDRSEQKKRSRERDRERVGRRDSEKKKSADDMDTGKFGPRPGNFRQNEESVRKDELLEFLVWVLHDQNDDENEELVSELTWMNETKSVNLADMLEHIPFDLFRKPMAGDEMDLPAWHERLRKWHEALTQRRARLEREETQQRSGLKYDIYLQYRQGEDAWRTFLENQQRQYKLKIQQTEVLLRELE